MLTDAPRLMQDRLASDPKLRIGPGTLSWIARFDRVHRSRNQEWGHFEGRSATAHVFVSELAEPRDLGFVMLRTNAKRSVFFGEIYRKNRKIKSTCVRVRADVPKMKKLTATYAPLVAY